MHVSKTYIFAIIYFSWVINRYRTYIYEALTNQCSVKSNGLLFVEPELLQQIQACSRGRWDFPFIALSRTLSLSLSLPLSLSLSLSRSPVDKTWAERMWNIYSEFAPSAMAAHTLYLPCREILSGLPLPPTPPESLSSHWPELTTNYMSHCSAFTTAFKAASLVPNISPQPDSLFQPGWKKGLCELNSHWGLWFIINLLFCILIEEAMQITPTALDFTRKKVIMQGFLPLLKCNDLFFTSCRRVLCVNVCMYKCTHSFTH